MADDFRPFVISVKRRWTLWILPVLATLYFIGVVLLNILDYEIKGVTTEMLALGGVAFFVLVMLIELPFFLRRRAPKPARQQTRAVPVTRAAAGEPESNGHGDDEYLLTRESQQGLQVLEYSSPAKSQNTNVVYTKTYVPVTPSHVLRVETAVATPSDL